MVTNNNQPEKMFPNNLAEPMIEETGSADHKELNKALFSSLWSADPVSSIIGSAKLFGNIFSGWLLFVTIKSLSIEEANLVRKFLSMGFFLAICIVVFEILLGGPP